MPRESFPPSPLSLARERRRSRPPPPARDMLASTFATILDDLVARIPGAYAATLVDHEGETVDYTGPADPFDLKLAAAHWQIVLAECSRFTSDSKMGSMRSLGIRGVQRSFLAHALPEGYSLVVLLRRRAGFSPLYRAFSVCERALIAEARWSPRPVVPEAERGPRAITWFAVSVALSRAKRPILVAPLPVPPSAPREIDVLGLVRGPALLSRERGYRVRTHSGLEFTLVREPGGFWYADEDISIA